MKTTALILAAAGAAVLAGSPASARHRHHSYRSYGYSSPYRYAYRPYSYGYPSYGYSSPYGYSYPSYGYSYPSYGYSYPSYGYSYPSYGYNQYPYSGYGERQRHYERDEDDSDD